jgi:flagellar biogenesis protein FliO
MGGSSTATDTAPATSTSRASAAEALAALADDEPKTSADTNSPRKARTVPGSLVPRAPDMWKMSSALVGVILLGGAVLLVVKKLKRGTLPRGVASLATLRQTVRLSSKQALHAIEFDQRILLVGENDKGLTLLDRGRLPDAAEDEATVLSRQQLEEEQEDGAVPRNLIIPRPPTAQQATQASPNQSSFNSQKKADQAIAKLNDFRTLLDKASR